MTFTVVFPGKAKQFPGNPFKAETPFGPAQTIEIGDICEQADLFREALEEIASGGQGQIAMQEIAQRALDAVSGKVREELGL
jgi:hypothetical protein